MAALVETVILEYLAMTVGQQLVHGLKQTVRVARHVGVETVPAVGVAVCAGHQEPPGVQAQVGLDAHLGCELVPKRVRRLDDDVAGGRGPIQDEQSPTPLARSALAKDEMAAAAL